MKCLSKRREFKAVGLYREARGSNKQEWGISQQLPGMIEALQDDCTCVQREGIRLSFFIKISRLKLEEKNCNIDVLPLTLLPNYNTNSSLFCSFSLRSRELQLLQKHGNSTV